MLRLTRPSAEYQTTRRNPALLPGLLLVILAHVALLYGLWSQRMIPPPAEMATLFVNFITASSPELSAPSYPPLSRRLGEEGKLVLRVELDESGHISVAQVINSSGHKRLDDAAMAAVKTWRCNPPRRNGIPVRAIALQPFNFVLHGD
jgi:protein TonB